MRLRVLTICLHDFVDTENVFVFYSRVWDTRNMQPVFTFPAQQYFQVFISEKSKLVEQLNLILRVHRFGFG